MPTPQLHRGSRGLTVLVSIAALIGALGLIGYTQTSSNSIASSPDTTTTTEAGSVEPLMIDGFGTIAFSVTPPGAEPRAYCALLANTPEAQANGMMRRTDMAGYDAMIFPFEEDSTARFYMANVTVPLSIAWISADGSFISAKDMPPCTTPDGRDCELFAADAPFRTAIEVMQGNLDDLGIQAGAKVEVGGPCPT